MRNVFHNMLYRNRQGDKDIQLIPRLNMRRYGYPPQQSSLGDAGNSQLKALSQQGNPSHAQLMEMSAAQQGMKTVAERRNIEVPKVNFYPCRHPDPRKSRKKDISQARRLLKPTKRTVLNPLRWLGIKYRYNSRAGHCVVDGCDCEELIKYDNLYAKICDEDNGRSLWEMYWMNPVTGEPEAFVARENVIDGRRMRGTYCPEHLHLYHLLCKWETESDKDHKTTKGGMKEMLKKGVSTIAVPISIIKKKDNTPPFLKKYESFFMELEKDSKIHNGIDLLFYKNPRTGVNNITMVVFNLDMFQKEIEDMDNVSLDDAIGGIGVSGLSATSHIGVGLPVSDDEGLSMVQNQDGSVSIELPNQ